MNTHKAFLVILFMIVFAIFLFTVSNKKRNYVIESFYGRGQGKKSNEEVSRTTKSSPTTPSAQVSINCSKKEKKINKLKNDKNRLETQIIDLNKKYDTLKEEKSSLEDEKSSLEEECSSNINELNNARIKLHMAKNKNKSLKTRIGNIKASLKDCYYSKDNCLTDMKKKNNLLSQISQVNSDLQQKYNTCNDNNMELNKTGASLTEETDFLRYVLGKANGIG